MMFLGLRHCESLFIIIIINLLLLNMQWHKAVWLSTKIVDLDPEGISVQRFCGFRIRDPEVNK
jgi:hypothetical protein